MRNVLRQLRQDLRESLIKAGCPDPVTDDAIQALNELATNAIQHTKSGWSPRGTFLVRWYLYTYPSRSPFLWAEVVNQGTTPPLDLSALPAGHGLDITRRLVTSLGTEVEEMGRVVWFKIEFDQDTGTITQHARRPPPAPATAYTAYEPASP
jgi:anti-sigma regulatory factor (Ser/Thr protein kinase)